MERLVATPFGQRSVTADLLKSIHRASERPALPHIDKWHLLRELCVARAAFGISDRELGVLEGLLSFHPEKMLGGNAEMVVWPSNRALAERCHGMAESTMRRHLGTLVERGLILRHDSPNGKRYAARGHDGEVLRAFGFDLSPLLVRASEIAQAAQATRETTARLKAVRERISLQKRDAQKLAAYALEQGYCGDWDGILAELLEVSRLMRRKLSVDELEHLAPHVENLRDCVMSNLHKTIELSGSDTQNERLLQNSNTDTYDLEPCLEKSREADGCSKGSKGNFEPEVRKSDRTTKEAQGSLPVGLVLKALPQSLEYAEQPIRSFDDLARLGAFLRGMIGISPSAWEDAVDAMGYETAGVTICCLVERIHDIRSPGGYLRHLSREAIEGRFSIARLVMALLQRPESSEVAKS